LNSSFALSNAVGFHLRPCGLSVLLASVEKGNQLIIDFIEDSSRQKNIVFSKNVPSKLLHQGEVRTAFVGRAFAFEALEDVPFLPESSARRMFITS
jgi:hypothetical protein